MALAGELHALSLDFNQEQLDQILSNAPSQIAAYLRQEISRDPVKPRIIDFEGEVVFGVRARLGNLQKGQIESFVPLVALEILSADKLTVKSDAFRAAADDCRDTTDIDSQRFAFYTYCVKG